MSATNFTPAIKTLIADAEKAGLEVRHKAVNDGGDSSLHIFKRDRRSKENLLVGVHISLFNGAFYVAHRTDIDASLTINIRTIKVVREILLGK